MLRGLPLDLNALCLQFGNHELFSFLFENGGHETFASYGSYSEEGEPTPQGARCGGTLTQREHSGSAPTNERTKPPAMEKQ